MNENESTSPHYRAAREELEDLIEAGKAIEILDRYYTCKQSCEYVYGIVEHVAHSDDVETICNGTRNFARNLLEDWSK